MGAGRTREFSVFSVNLKPLKKKQSIKKSRASLVAQW